MGVLAANCSSFPSCWSWPLNARFRKTKQAEVLAGKNYKTDPCFMQRSGTTLAATLIHPLDQLHATLSCPLNRGDDIAEATQPSLCVEIWLV